MCSECAKLMFVLMLFRVNVDLGFYGVGFRVYTKFHIIMQLQITVYIVTFVCSGCAKLMLY